MGQASLTSIDLVIKRNIEPIGVQLLRTDGPSIPIWLGLSNQSNSLTFSTRNLPMWIARWVSQGELELVIQLLGQNLRQRPKLMGLAYIQLLSALKKVETRR